MQGGKELAQSKAEVHTVMAVEMEETAMDKVGKAGKGDFVVVRAM
ncbi:hypothetical protein [Pasteurella multocida]|nr:hypothetical protein [Pasteurella multocida]